MKKIIVSLAMAGIVLSPVALFAANPAQITGSQEVSVTTSASVPTTGVTTQEKVLVKKLASVKKKSKDTKQKIATNIKQAKAKVVKVKKTRTNLKKAKKVIASKKVKSPKVTTSTTATTVVR